MGIMVYSLLWVMQDFVHQPSLWEENMKSQAEVAALWFVPLGLSGLGSCRFL